MFLLLFLQFLDTWRSFFFYLEEIFCYLKEIIYSRINTVVIVKLFLKYCISVS